MSAMTHDCGRSVFGHSFASDRSQRFRNAKRQAALAILGAVNGEQGRQSITPGGWTPQSTVVHFGDVARHWRIGEIARTIIISIARAS